MTVWLALLGVGCTHSTPPASGADAGPSQTPDASTPVTVDAGMPDAGAPPGYPDACGNWPASLGSAPIRRLTATEYLNTVNDLFASFRSQPWQTRDFDLSASDARVDGFDNNAITQSPSPLLIEQYRNTAEQIAGSVQSAVMQSLKCPTGQNGAPSDPSGCARNFITTFGRLAFRRPLTSDELTRFQGLFAAAFTDQGFVDAVGTTIEVFLQSPQFLYRPELGTTPVDQPANPTWSAVAPYEVASRLSYFLWRTMPDEALLQAAAAGDLATPAGLEKQARRLLADPRARATIADFHRAWFSLDAIDLLFVWPGTFMNFDPSSTPGLLKESAARFIDHEMWEGDGKLNTLLTDNHAYVNDALAPIYGVPAPNSQDLVLVETDPSQRSGLLTQPGILAEGSHVLIESPVHRGVFVLRNLLCAEPPPPPPSVTALPRTTGGMSPTTRDLFTAHENQASCKGCHQQIDGIGFGFEAYDALGQFRTMENNGEAVDSSGWLYGTLDADGTYNGPNELVQKLVKSEQVSDCVVRQHFRYGFGRTEDRTQDACSIQKLRQKFDATGGDMRELLVQVILSDQFRYLAPSAQGGQ